MRLGLVQTKQNQLYDFQENTKQIGFTREVSYGLQKEMVDQTLKLMKQACIEGCDVLVAPESINFCGRPEWLTGNYSDMFEELQGRMAMQLSVMAKTYQTYLFVGAIVKRKDGEGTEYLTNSCLVYEPDGRMRHIYDKIHLAGDEKSWYRSGKSELVVDTKYGKIGVCICWDMQFPELPRMLALSGAKLIVCPTWGWEGIYGHARAYENGVFVAAAMGVPFEGHIEGIRNPSEIVAPDGNVRMAAHRDRAQYIICEIDLQESDSYCDSRLKDRMPQLYGKLCIKHSTEPAEVVELTDYIKDHYSEKLTLEDMARRVYLNPYYFSSLFKKKTGINFKNYLTNIRMEQAWSMVVSTDLRIEDIAESVGYHQVRQFIEKFREYYGGTPFQFRKNMG